jgi:glycosyltransferase involved in cell wall biosynthesis
MAGPTSPNVDALRWFVNDVLPFIVERIPEARIIVTGADAPPDVVKLASGAVRLTGYVDDLAALYADARVAIAPIRFGAGVKIKAVEAIQYGVPVVATTTGAEGIVLDEPACVAVRDDARGFADAVVRMLSDEAAWCACHEAAVRQAGRWQNHRPNWRDVIDGVRERRVTSRGAARETRAALALVRDP